MCRRAILSPPKTPKPSLPMLIIKMFRELREDKFIEHSEIGNSVYIPFEKVRSKNHPVSTKCCPDRKVLSRIAPFKIECRRVSFWRILWYIVCVDSSQLLRHSSQINGASSPISKLAKKFSRQQRSLNHTEKRNRRAKSPGNNSCRTCIRYGCHFMSYFVIRLKLEQEI